jgi:hypothetical protein
MFKKLFCFLFIVGFSTICFSEEIATPKKQSEAFIDGVIKGKIDKAAEALFSGTFLKETKNNEIDLMVRQMQAQLPVYGKFYGKELISEDSITSRIVKLQYAMYSDKMPIYWVLYFYQRNENWEITQIFFKDQPNILNQ